MERSWVAYGSDAQSEITGNFEDEVGAVPSTTQIGQYEAYLNSGASLSNLWGALSQQSAPVVTTLYVAVLDRDPTSPEVSSSEGYFAGGATQADIRSSLAQLPEVTSNLDNLILRVQGRTADTNDASWISAQQGSLGSGAQTFAQIQTGLATWSGEAGVIAPAVLTVFGYTPAQAEISTDEAQLGRGGSIGTVLQGDFTASPLNHDVSDTVEQVLSAVPSQSQVTEAEQLLSAGLNSATFILSNLASTLATDALSSLQYFDPIDTAAANTTTALQAQRLKTAAADLANPNVQGVLNMIKAGESSGGDYTILYRPPNTPVQHFTDTSTFPSQSPLSKSSAMGAYGITRPTYTIEHLRLGLTDVTDGSQDLMAVDDLIRHNVMSILLQPTMSIGDFNTVLSRIANEWKSLPVGAPIGGVPGTGADHSYYTDPNTGAYIQTKGYSYFLGIFEAKGHIQ